MYVCNILLQRQHDAVRWIDVVFLVPWRDDFAGFRVLLSLFDDHLIVGTYIGVHDVVLIRVPVFIQGLSVRKRSAAIFEVIYLFCFGGQSEYFL